jgi:asparagine N-glycosylation enzyme membrane subunit Stt3
MIGFGTERNLEASFTVGFSLLVFVLFFSFLGANGLVLGNDPAVHLQTAQSFLETGKVPLMETWYPPLYHIILDTFIAFTGFTSVSELLFLMKAVTALIDWFLVFSVYLVAAKFFNKKTGVLAAALLILCFPIYEINAWGGYTSILALAFMMLAILYLGSPLKGIENTLLAFIFGFSVVLSHQLATFMAVFILPPFLIYALVKSRGHYPKALIAALLGGGIAFGIYYVRPLLPYLGDLVYIIFFQLTLYKYQIPAVTGQAFVVNFGFILFLAIAGLAVSFFELKKRNSLSFFLLLGMAFLVPAIFSQSYLVGIYLPFQWFVYYILPPLAVLAGVTLAYLIDTALVSYFNNKKGWQRNFLKALSIIIVCSLVAVMAMRFGTVSEKIDESTQFYSISDVNAYEAGTWLRQNFQDTFATAVVTQQPGHWFGVYSGNPLIAQTDSVIEWNVKAESVLALSYEMEQPATMLRVYEEKAGNVSSENFIYENMAWTALSYFDENSASLLYCDQNKMWHSFVLSSLNRTIAMDEVSYPKSISIKYTSEEFTLTERILASNDSYPMTVTWQLSALKNDLTYAKLYLNYYVNPTFTFSKAYVPSVLNWKNPWENISKTRNGWGVTDFSIENLVADNYVSIFDQNNKAALGLKFDDLPNAGTVGVLANNNIDAVRFEYHFYKIDANYTVSKTYQLLTFSQSSLPELENLTGMNSLFAFKTAEPFKVDCRNFASIIRDNNISFIVYDKQHFDHSLLNSKWIEIVYTNDKYVICKINPNHPYVNIKENNTTA